jgi:hypothetical protein
VACSSATSKKGWLHCSAPGKSTGLKQNSKPGANMNMFDTERIWIFSCLFAAYIRYAGAASPNEILSHVHASRAPLASIDGRFKSQMDSQIKGE